MVHPNRASAVSPAWPDDLDWQCQPRVKSPQPCSGGVAQEGLSSTGEERCFAVAVGGEARVADGVDAPVDAVQPSQACCPVDGAIAVPERLKLLARNDPVLRARQCGEVVVRSHFPSHTEEKGERKDSRPRGSSWLAPAGRFRSQFPSHRGEKCERK